MGQEFLGVYATSEAAPSLGDFPRSLGKRKRLWFVWETPEGKYTVQALNAVHEPMTVPRVIAPDEFQRRYTPEPGCPAVPEGYVKPGEAGEPGEPPPLSPLPDLFVSGAAPPNTPSFLYGNNPDGEGRLRADDPDLLRNWARSGQKRKKEVLDPVKIPFDRLVEELGHDEPGSGASERAFVPPEGPVSEEAAQPEEARLLRSKFVQALLLLRRGEREGAIILLRDMLENAYPPFTGAAQLFSEFGLGLRRLGLVTLALGAHRRASEYAPRDERILFNIARSYHDLGLLDEAREYLENALAISPDFASARQFLDFLNSGKHTDA